VQPPSSLLYLPLDYAGIEKGVSLEKPVAIGRRGRLAVLVDFFPHLPYLGPFVLDFTPVQILIPDPLLSQACDQLLFIVIAQADRFPHEALCVAFLQRSHDLFAPGIVFRKK
jgi:hypothetical protein